MNKVVSAAAVLAVSLAAHPSFAQKAISKQETVIIKQKSNQPQTIIEIEGNNVVVNGDTVASLGGEKTTTTLRKKIIIDHEGDAPALGSVDTWAPAMPSRKAMLGVLTNPQNADNGAVIENVQPNSPAASAGLQKGDKILKVDDKTIKSSKDLVETIAGYNAGDKVNLTYERKGKTQQAEAKLKKADAGVSYRSSPSPFGDLEMNDPGMPNGMGGFPFNFNFGNPEATAPAPKLGVQAEDRADGNGVRVVTVKTGSAAEKAGLQADDVITHLNSEKIGSVDELQLALRELKEQKFSLKYQRNGKPLTAQVTLSKPLRKKDL